MTVAAIIAEYNPFHEGHQYQIKQTRKATGADYVLVLMSGDFVQRGEPAIFDKYMRTEQALLGGADAVFELPSLYALSSAEYFAEGAVTILDKLGVVHFLSFGCETADRTVLSKNAQRLNDITQSQQHAVLALLKEGLTYPAARQQVFEEIADGDVFLSQPNDILALEYCKTLHKLNSSIQPFPIQRIGSGYHDTALTASFPSSTALRQAIMQNHSDEVTRLGKSYPDAFLSADDFSAVLYYALLSSAEDGYGDILDCTSSLSNRIRSGLDAFTQTTAFCQLCKTKDLTYTRVSRVLMHILLQMKTPSFYREPFHTRELFCPYVRLLGFQKKSEALLSAIRRESRIPIISKLADASFVLSAPAYAMLQQDLFASQLYEGIFSTKYAKKPVNEIRRSPIIL